MRELALGIFFSIFEFIYFSSPLFANSPGFLFFVLVLEGETPFVITASLLYTEYFCKMEEQ